MSGSSSRSRDHFGRMQRLDHARPVEQQRAMHRLAVAHGHESLALRFGQFGEGMKSQTCTRASGPTLIPAVVRAQRA